MRRLPFNKSGRVRVGGGGSDRDGAETWHLPETTGSVAGPLGIVQKGGEIAASDATMLYS